MACGVMAMSWLVHDYGGAMVMSWWWCIKQQDGNWCDGGGGALNNRMGIGVMVVVVH